LTIQKFKAASGAMPRTPFKASGLLRDTFLHIFIVIALFCAAVSATAVSTSSRNEFLHSHRSLTNGSTSTNKTETLNKIRDSVQCYALPYGGLGFASHVMTYYCIVVNAYGRKPLTPWKKQQYQLFNVIVGFLQLIGTTISGTLTVTRCRGTSQLQLLGIWMVLTSGASSIAAILGHGRWMCAGSRQPDGFPMVPPAPPDYNPNGFDPALPPQAFGNSGYQYNDPSKPQFTPHYYTAPQAEQIIPRAPIVRRLFSKDTTDYKLNGNRYGQWVSWGSIITIWLAGCIIGLIGSISIAVAVWNEVGRVKSITEWFFLPPGVMIGITILICCCGGSGRKPEHGPREFTETDIEGLWAWMKWTYKVCLFFLVFMLVYMDWLLAAVTNNWAGVPSKLDKGGKILYWVYFICKRLALFMA
jgi:hypothetical protein